MRAVLELSDRVVVLNEGEVIAERQPARGHARSARRRGLPRARAMLLEARAPGHRLRRRPRGVGRLARGGRRRGRLGHRAQRRGQEHAGQRHRRPAPRARGRAALRRRRPRRRAAAPRVPPRHRAGAGGAPAVHADVGRGEPRDRLLSRRGARGARRDTLERVYGLFPILRERRRQLAGSLSGGQQQMVAIGRGAHGAARACCCSTSRRSAWRRPSSTRCSRSSAPSTPRAWPSCSSSRTSSGRSRSPTAPTCSRRAGWWPTGARRRSCAQQSAHPGGVSWRPRRPEPTSTVEGRHEHGVIKVRDLAYGRLRAPDLDVMEEFLTHFGMIRVGADAESPLYMRGTDSRHHLHVTEKGDPKFVGLRLLRGQRGRPGAAGQGAGRLRGGVDRRARRRQARAPARAQRLPDRGRARHRARRRPSPCPCST